jgi:hypothetical protein
MFDFKELTVGRGPTTLLFLFVAIMYVATSSTGNVLYSKCGIKESRKTFLTVNMVASVTFLLFVLFALYNIVTV